MPVSEETLKGWAKGPGTTEQEKCDNAETAIRKAINAHERLSAMEITVFPQGSYRNRTNVKQDSDVDICVRLNSTFFPDYPTGTTKETYGNIDGSVSFQDYKNLVQTALASYFGEDAVTRGNKAFDVHANTYRVDADVVAAFEHRRYTGGRNPDGSHFYLSGIGFDTDDGKRITNWPDQHYENGLQKHEGTSRRFRKVIRVLKRLRNRMKDESVAGAKDIQSCLIEHLVWNTPNDSFGRETLRADVRAALAHAFNQTRKNEDCNEWGEVSELKYLFRPQQPWTREQAHNFISAAWDYIGFE